MSLDSAPLLPTPSPGLRPTEMDELDSILAAGRQLSSAKAMLDLLRQVLEDIDMLASEAGRILVLIADPALPGDEGRAALARYQRNFQEILSLLAASRHVSQLLMSNAEDGNPGMLRSLDLLERIASRLPRPPADSAAARAMLPDLSAFTLAVLEARDSFAADRGAIEAQLSLNLEQLDDQQATLGALEDTDLLKEAARLQALQIRQQLAGHAIGLGALVPRCLLDLRSV